MRRILFLTSVYDFHDKGNLNVDLIDVIVKHGNEVTVITPKERKYKLNERVENHGHITTLQFKCLNFRGKVNVIEKGISTLFLGHQYKHAVKKYFGEIPFDIVIYTTLPITYLPVLKFVKEKYGTYCYLQHKDFFPQSAVDLEIIKKGSIVYCLFKRIERKLFLISDKIGLMSPKNVEYILRENPWLEKEKTEYCPNGINPTSDEKIASLRRNKMAIRNKYRIPNDAVVFIYGGNISRAQGVEFIKKMLTILSDNAIKRAYFLLIGSGNEYDSLKNHIDSLDCSFIKMLSSMPKNEFDEILSTADVGMVFLDQRFTIANIPSRTLSHMDMGQAIIAATDDFTDYRELIENNELGLWCLNGDEDAMLNNINKMVLDDIFREKCGQNARNYLVNHSTAEIAYSIIERSYSIRR
ncbi:MAG: glycosyltransferase family 4 protein [Syntrophomonas sp.]